MSTDIIYLNTMIGYELLTCISSLGAVSFSWKPVALLLKHRRPQCIAIPCSVLTFTLQSAVDDYDPVYRLAGKQTTR